ncbi:MAG TPA: hypothetical protein VKD47_10265 [Miltoncostaeaceae bacterium]|nr:hypothetical protein [Miltoncostaeaceae bacterium]
MTRLTPLAVAALALAVAIPAGMAAGAATPPVAVSVSPPVLFLQGATTTTLAVTNPSSQPTTILVRTGNYNVAADGGVRIDPKLPPARSAKAWLRVSPRSLTLGPGQRGTVTVVAAPPRVAAPGDHHALVLLAGTGGRAAVAIRAQVGVNVIVRVSGPLVRSLRVTAPRVRRVKRRRVIAVPIANRGNVVERLLRKQVTVELRRGRKLAARVAAASTIVLPGTAVTLRVPVPRRLKGRYRAVVVVRPAKRVAEGPGVRALKVIRKARAVRL